MLNANRYDPAYDFAVEGVSYIGRPKSGTAMFTAHKLQALLQNLQGLQHCLVFVDEKTQVPQELRQHHCFVVCANPSAAYGEVAEHFWRLYTEAESTKRYTLAPEGYYIGEDVHIGEGATIEPGVLIGHGVSIGSGARLEAGAKIYCATIGNGCLIKSNAVVGNQSIAPYTLPDGTLRRTYHLGWTVLGDGVEVGSCATVNRGVAGNTVLHNHVMLDDHVYVPHDVEIGENTRVIGGTSMGGYCTIGKSCYIGLNVVLRNRITVGDNAFIGMGSVVTRDVPPSVVVYGNPARIKEKR